MRGAIRRGDAARRAATPADIALARALFVEYAHWLKVDLCFQGFDRELAALPGAYAPPRGRLLLAGAPGEAFGCIALRPLGAIGGSADGVSTARARDRASARSSASMCNRRIEAAAGGAGSPKR